VCQRQCVARLGLPTRTHWFKVQAQFNLKSTNSTLQYWRILALAAIRDAVFNEDHWHSEIYDLDDH
jgi:hypothetical protein